MPRRFVGAYSARNVDAPAYSPDAEKPWIALMMSSNSGARKPIAAYDGIKPMQKVAPVINIIDADSAHLRPNLSPICPHTRAPIGRRRNDRANTA